MKKLIYFIVLLLILCIRTDAKLEKLTNFWGKISVKGDTVLLSTIDYYLLFSTNNGSNWDSIKYLRKFDVVPYKTNFQDSTIIAGSSSSYNDTNLVISRDFGTTWKNYSLKSQFGIINHIYSIEFNKEEIYIGGDMGFMKSYNKGFDWVPLKICDSSGEYLDKNFEFSIFTYKILIKDDKIYIFERFTDGIYSSSNGGNSWEKIYRANYTDTFPGFYDFTVVDSAIILVNSNKLIYSTNKGKNWNYGYEFTRSNQVDKDTTLLNILGCGNNVFVGSDKGLFFSNDFGKSLIRLNFEFDNLYVNTLDKNEKFIFICTGRVLQTKCSIYRTQISNCEILGATDLETQKFEQINSISPNPAGEYIKISGLNKGLQPLVQGVEIKIYNLLGECLFTTFEPGGTHPLIPSQEGNIRIDISGLPTGVYFVRVGDWVGRFLKI